MTEKIVLSDTHKRVVSTSLKIIEKSLEEIIFLINSESSSLVKVKNDIENTKIVVLINSIKDIKLKLDEMTRKYDLFPDYYSLQQILLTKKTYLWSILQDLYSHNLDKYGTFYDSQRTEFDNDITEIINMINDL